MDLLAFAAAGAITYYVWKKVESGESFTASSFFGGAEDKTVTFYYTNWCGYCTKMKPIWAIVAGSTPGVTFHENNEEDSPTAGITGYPTILLVSAGKTHKYAGPADVAALQSWIKTTA